MWILWPNLFRWRYLKVLLLLAVTYTVITVGYYYLPWSVRQKVYNHAPTVDRTLRKSGFNILKGWDDLAWVGRDARVNLPDTYRADYAYAGLPQQDVQRFGRVEMLENRGYVAGYSESLRNPLWVTYRIFDVPKLRSGKRPSRFKPDVRTRSQVAHSDYTHSGFDRGHLAPNFGIATRYGREAQLETFLMSNIIPQSPGVNRHLWKDLEMRVAKRYGRYFREVWVITGPVFQGEMAVLDSGVAVPSAYYKVIIDEHGDELRALAFLVPRNVPPFTRIRSCLVSIDDVEQKTGLDFLRELPDDMESELEAQSASRLWPWIGPAVKYRLFGETR